MKEKKHLLLIVILLVILVALVALAVGIGLRVRSSHLEGASITTELDLVDISISQGDMNVALDSLGRLEKRALTVYDWLGIYKRYAVLAEIKRAEKCLVRALKKFPKNAELEAVYGTVLLRQGRFEEAAKKTASLSGTPYGSIYAEALLRKALQKHITADEVFRSRPRFFLFRTRARNADAGDSLFWDRRFIPVYKDAFTGSHIAKWMINASTLLMLDGKYAEAADLYPGQVGTIHDALFWGLVLYDAGRYAGSLEALRSADSFDFSADITSAIELRALESDDYYILGDDVTAQQMREHVLDVTSPYIEAFVKDKTPSLHALLPLVFMNTALYARNTGDPAEQYEKLYELVNYYPYYEPGLAAYAEYAIASQNRPAEDLVERQIRAAGLRTVGMAQRDAVPVVSLAEAIERVETAMDAEKTPQLLVLREQIRAEENRGDEKNVKASKVWQLLEENEISAFLYPAEIMQYVVLTLIENDAVQDAETLFSDYMQAAYRQERLAAGVAEDSIGQFNPADEPERLRLWECEVAAYFAIRRGDVHSARTLYATIADSYASRSPMMNTSGQNGSVINAYINLGNIYAGYNEAPQALDVLNKALGRVTDPSMRAEVLYRIASEWYVMGNNKEAVRSLQYAVSLNPDHNRARLLLKQAQSSK